MTLETGNGIFLHLHKEEKIKPETQITHFTDVFFHFTCTGFCLRTLGCLNRLYVFRKLKLLQTFSNCSKFQR